MTATGRHRSPPAHRPSGQHRTPVAIAAAATALLGAAAGLATIVGDTITPSIHTAGPGQPYPTQTAGGVRGPRSPGPLLIPSIGVTTSGIPVVPGIAAGDLTSASDRVVSVDCGRCATRDPLPATTVTSAVSVASTADMTTTASSPPSSSATTSPTTPTTTGPTSSVGTSTASTRTHPTRRNP